MDGPCSLLGCGHVTPATEPIFATSDPAAAGRSSSSGAGGLRYADQSRWSPRPSGASPKSATH